MTPTEQTIHRQLRWETDSRYYVARAYQDLLGDWIVEKAWGGLTNKLGNGKQEIVSSFDAAVSALTRIRKERSARHYWLVNDVNGG
jgi:hypothetical protein